MKNIINYVDYNNPVNEGFFKDLIKSVFKKNKNQHTDIEVAELEKIIQDSGINNDKVFSLLDNILNHENSQRIDLNTLSRTLKNVLLKRGEKSVHILKYFNRILDSLNKRNFYKNKYQDEDFIDSDEEEISLIPGKEFDFEKKNLQVELLKMQEWLKDSNKSVVIVFEGRDTAGKGSTIKKFTEYLDPKFFKIITKGIPTEEEKKNWFERYRKDIEPGKIIFFDRSWYNRGVVEPVMGYSTYDEYQDFMANVTNFEQELIDSGSYLIKFWLSITKDTQERRFSMRQSSPLRYWKYSPNDAKAQEKWKEYTNYKRRMFKVTSTDAAPWVVVDSNDKRISGLNSIRYVLSKVPYVDKNEDLIEITYPEVITTIK